MACTTGGHALRTRTRVRRATCGDSVVRRWRTTLIVAGIFVALLLYVVLFEARREPPAGPGPSRSAPSPTPASVLAIDTGNVQALHIAAGDRSLSLVRQGEEWAIAPAATVAGASTDAVPAEASVYWSIDEILQLDARLVVAEGAADLTQYGLDGPAMTVTMETTSGASEQLRIGRQTPDGTAYYLQHAGDPRLYIVDHYKIQTLYEWLADPPYAPTPAP
jgi:hypothetical protein